MSRVPPKHKQNLEGLLRLAVEHTGEDAEPAENLDNIDTQKQEFLQGALQSMSMTVDEVQYALAKLNNDSISTAEKLECLDIIRDNIDDIDAANSFVKVGGITTLLAYIRTPNRDLRPQSIYIVAEMAQNNEFCQNYFLNEKLIPVLTSTMNDTDEDLAKGSIYAVSSLVQNFPAGLKEFLRTNGVKQILACLSSNHSPVYIKAAFLIATLSSNDNSFRDLVNKQNAAQILLSKLEAKDEYDDKQEATLYALSALSVNSKWKLPSAQQKEAAVTLKQIINNKALADTCEETIQYARTVLNTISK
ncbi:hsp70-binding protein 1 [Drosophila sulfurigaster albostrigata]|uniref:hsp70-binding protein 1 n=1 Tax=Drosophila sulfurigaster albostrigata TaxID=89887 RepID=UPI002D21C551|nr:hsp70-binding protein 1 [Drosophila sulfurigaster albostrigata]